MGVSGVLNPQGWFGVLRGVLAVGARNSILSLVCHRPPPVTAFALPDLTPPQVVELVPALRKRWDGESIGKRARSPKVGREGVQSLSKEGTRLRSCRDAPWWQSHRHQPWVFRCRRAVTL